MICTPVCEKNLQALKAKALQACELADVVELRLDCLEAVELAHLNLGELLSSLNRRVIVTLRATEQGGRRALTVEERSSFWRKCLKSNGSVLFDIELNLAIDLAAQGLLPDWSRIICSHHDFDGVPSNLDELYGRMAQTGAAVIKIACKANDTVDCLSLFQLLERAQREGQQMIAIAMCNSGIATRILGPSRGGYLTYGALQEDSTTAPGQLTVQQLRSVYRIQNINRDTQIFGLIGKPVMHSVSPHIHNAAFANNGINGVFMPFEVQDAPAFLSRMVHPQTRAINWRCRGLSVTAPHKRAVIDSLDWVDPFAAEIGAVNTVVVEDSKLRGYNTDAHGLIQPLKQRLGELKNLRVAIIGAGGAANAAIWSLLREGAAVTVFARNPTKASQLANRFGVSVRALEAAGFGDYEVVINATPLGSAGEQKDLSPVAEGQLRGVGLVYDLVYNPLDTLLLRRARSVNCDTLSGLQMLVAQAALQFKLWTGVDAPVDVMHAAAQAALK